MEQPQLEKGEMFAAFPAFDLESRPRLVNLVEDEQESLVFVFTTVCPACQENQTNWRKLYEQAQGRYEVIGISLNDIEATVKYREANDLPFPVVVPEDIRGFSSAYKIDRVPLTLQIDRDGRVRGSWLGVLDKDTLSQLPVLSSVQD